MRTWVEMGGLSEQNSKTRQCLSGKIVMKKRRRGRGGKERKKEEEKEKKEVDE